MKLLSTGLWLGVASAAAEVRNINKRDASNFLLRTTRSNSGLAEELLPSDLERECNEEACRYEEVRETGLSETQAEQFFLKQTKPCSFENSCISENTDTCINGWGTYVCECNENWYGARCEYVRGLVEHDAQNVYSQKADFATEKSPEYFEEPESENIIIPDSLESGKLELITKKLGDGGDEVVHDQEKIDEKRAMIRQQLTKLADLYELISMMRATAKEESTKTSLDQIKMQLDKMKAQLDAKLEDHASSLTFTKDAASAIQQLLDSMFRQVLPPLIPKNLSTNATQNYSVECGTDYMTVDLADHFLNDLQLKNSAVLVKTHNHESSGSNSCPDFAVNLSTNKISIPISSCLIQKSKNSTFLTYSYEIFVPPKTVSTLVTEYGNHWMATCHYENRKTVSVSKNGGFGALSFPEKVGIHGSEDTDGLDDVKGVGQFDVQIDAFMSEKFEEKFVEYPIAAALGERLNFEISFTTAEQAKNHYLIAEQCWTFPEENDFSKISLINDRCVSAGVNSIVRILDRPQSNVDRWGSQVFKFPGDNNKVFIQCRVLICYDEDDCRRACDRRSKRSIAKGGQTQNVEKIVTSGLLRLKRSVEGSSSVEKSSVNKSSVADQRSVYIPMSLNFVLLAVVAAFVMLAVYAARDYEQEEVKKSTGMKVQGVSNTAFDGQNGGSVRTSIDEEINFQN